MKPVYQTYFTGLEEASASNRNHTGIPVGNCFQAVVASILELDLEDVPHFVDIDVRGGQNWLEHTDEWLRHRGLELNWLYKHEVPEDEYVVVHGLSPRGNWSHVVVYLGGEMVHDPHPDGTGVLTQDHFCTIRKMA